MDKSSFKDKLKSFSYRYTDFITLQGIGGYWTQQFVQYVPVGVWITESALYALFFERFGVPFWAIVIFTIFKNYAKMAMRWVIGKIAIKTEVYKAQNMYGAKQEHIAPFNKELIDQLNAIGNKLGVTSKFTEL